MCAGAPRPISFSSHITQPHWCGLSTSPLFLVPFQRVSPVVTGSWDAFALDMLVDNRAPVVAPALGLSPGVVQVEAGL